MTFDAGATFDPAALEAAVRKVDFTSRGVTVWIHGSITTDDSVDPATAWLHSDGDQQRFRLVAGADGDPALLQPLRESAPGSMTVHGTATGPDENGIVTVTVQGTSSDE